MAWVDAFSNLEKSIAEINSALSSVPSMTLGKVSSQDAIPLSDYDSYRKKAEDLRAKATDLAAAVDLYREQKQEEKDHDLKKSIYSAKDAEFSYEYNGRNRLTSIIAKSKAIGKEVTISYDYSKDPRGCSFSSRDL